MTPRPSNSMSVALLFVTLTCGSVAAAEWATKDEAIAMVKKAVARDAAGDEKSTAVFRLTCD